MKVNSITTPVLYRGNQNNQNKKYAISKHSMVSATGYTAFAGGLVCAFSGIRHNMITHRISAMIALAAAAAHIVLLKTMHGKKYS